jgi:BNR repeat-like domain
MRNRRQFLSSFSGAALAVAVSARGAGPAVSSWVAIQNVCAWPKLERLTDGTLIAVIFNQPCHGLWEGDLDCWASRDEGRTWRFRARVAGHEPTQARMNCALGKAANGDLIALCGGWTDRNPPWQPSSGAKRRTLRPLVSRSADGGQTWKITGSIPEPPSTKLGEGNQYIPFGEVQQAADGSLCAAVYLKRGERRQCFLLRSADDGKTWKDLVVLHPYGNETALLHLGSGKWIAACREFQPGRDDMHLEQYVSEDDAQVWKRRQPLTMPGQVPGHLLRLRDGRILLAYGNRNWNNCGVDARVSKDEGKTWGAPFRIAHSPMPDSGYPSSVQLAGGDIVTAYYTKVSDDFHYEMRVARWNPPTIRPGPE